LYITENCHECGLATKHIEEHELPVKIINKSRDERPHNAFVFPALFRDKDLICYGASGVKEHFLKVISKQAD
jgi:hypothetical protein